MLVDQAKERGFHPKTLGGDKGFDTGDRAADLRRRGVTPHVAQNTNGPSSAIDGRTTRHPGYTISQGIRKRVDLRMDENRGWVPADAVSWAGPDRSGGIPVTAAYNLMRMAKLLGPAKSAPSAKVALRGHGLP